MKQETSTNYAEPTLSLSTETDKPISGNGSLKIDIRPAATVEEAVNSLWSILSTDFIPLKENKYYNYRLDVFGIDVINYIQKFIIMIQMVPE